MVRNYHKKPEVFIVSFRKGQQYDCKWYIPLADLTFQTIDDCESSPIPLVQDEEIDAMKIKISQIKNEIQREKVRADLLTLELLQTFC